MLELLELAGIVLAGPLLLAAAAVAWLRHDQRQEMRQRRRRWRQLFLEDR